MRTNSQRAPLCYRRVGRAALLTAVVGLPVLSLAHTVGAVFGGETGRKAVSLTRPHIVVIKGNRLLHLFDGDELIRTYAIDLGSDPVPQKQAVGDGRTPIGAFRVATKNPDSPYGRFIGIDYPDAPAVERGLRNGLISPGEAASIREAARARACPDWGTALGGGIGIHGAGTGRDWTAGCIAVSDEHVVDLFDVLRVGDAVEILP